MSKLHNRRKERGYTAIELGAAIAGGLIFIAIATFGILRALDNNRYSTLVQMVTAQVPQALVATLSNSGSLVNGLGTAAAGAKTRIEAAGVPADTPWGTPGRSRLLRLQVPTRTSSRSTSRSVAREPPTRCRVW
jgi:hypothetical protein